MNTSFRLSIIIFFILILNSISARAQIGRYYNEDSNLSFKNLLITGIICFLIYFIFRNYRQSKSDKYSEAIKENQERLAPKVTKPSGTFYRFVIYQTATHKWYYIDSYGKSAFHAINNKPIASDFKNSLLDFVLVKEYNNSTTEYGYYWDEIIDFKGDRGSIVISLSGGYVAFKNSEFLKINYPDITNENGKLLHEIY